MYMVVVGAPARWFAQGPIILLRQPWLKLEVLSHKMYQGLIILGASNWKVFKVKIVLFVLLYYLLRKNSISMETDIVGG